MKYESVQQAREALKKLEQTQAAYITTLWVFCTWTLPPLPPATLGRGGARPWRSCLRSPMICW